MKKIGSLLLTTVLLITSSFSVSVFAQGNTNANNIGKTTKIIFSKAEIKNTDLLLDRAKKGISDSDLSKLPEGLKNKEFVVTDDKGNTKHIKTVLTTQLLSEVETPEGNVQNYALNILTDNKVLSTSATGGTQSNGENDPETLGIYAYSTIYYSLIFSSPTQIRLDRVTGGWQIKDGTESISNKSVTYGTSGSGSNGLPVSQTGTKPVSGFTFNYYTGFTKYIQIGGYLSATLGATSKCTITTRGSSWSFSMVNKY